MLKFAIDKVIENIDLTEEEMIKAMNIIMEGKAVNSQISALLVGLRMKGETIDEIVGSAKVMRTKALTVNFNAEHVIDTCGTGGDGANTFNISTAAAFVAAGAGVTVLKHGNRSVSSRCGSADVLEKLGVNIKLKPIEVEKCVKKINIGFMFAPIFHKAMQHAVQTRKELRIRTIFNLLGPLTNPACVQGQIIGVFDKSLTEVIAKSLNKLGVNRALVVHGLDGLDEITVTTKTKVSELKNNEIKTYYINPSEYGISLVKREELVGGNCEENAEIILNILKGKKSAKRDIVLLNSGAAIYISKKAETLEEGIEMAKKIIDNGTALEKLNSLIKYSKDVNL